MTVDPMWPQALDRTLSNQIYSLHQVCGARRRAQAMPTRPSRLCKERYVPSAFIGGCAQLKKLTLLAILLFANRYSPSVSLFTSARNLLMAVTPLQQTLPRISLLLLRADADPGT